MVNRWSNHIFIFLISYTLYHTFSYANPSIPPPCKEKCSLDNIKLTSFIPKVTLHSIHHDFSLFNTYLQSHGITISLNNKAIEWKVLIPNKAKHPNLIEANLNITNEALTSNKIENRPTHEIEIEHIQNIFLSKDFLLDVISSLQKNKDYQEIHAIFYPDQRISVDMLQKKLFNSLEFRVLSQTEKNYPKDKIFKSIVEKKDTTQLFDSYLQKQRAVLTPHFNACTLQLKNIDSQELLQNFNRCGAQQQIENAGEIALASIGLPIILSSTFNCYRYIPSINVEAFTMYYPIVKYLKKNTINRFCTPISIDLQSSEFLLSSIKFQKVHKLHSPEKASIKASYLPINCSITTQKNPFPKKPIKLSSIQKLKIKPIEDISSKNIEKHLFADVHFAIPYTKEFFPINSFEIATSKKAKTSLPNKEQIIYYMSAPIPLVLNNLNKNHFFFSKRIKRIPSSNLIVKKTPSKCTKSTLEKKKSLKEIDLCYNNLDISLSGITISKYMKIKKVATNEPIKPNISTNLNILQKKNINPHIPLSSAYILKNDKEISFAETFIGRLCKQTQKNNEIFYSEEGYNFFSLHTPLKFSEITINKSNAKKQQFLANKENQLLAYKEISNKRINSNISRTSHQSFHAFLAALNQVQNTKNIPSAANLITTEKHLINICSSLEISPYALHINNETLSKEKSYFFNISPLQTSKIYLENYIYPQKIQFISKVSLPKLISINNKTSFFLNPLLSLINSNAYDIEADILDTASKTNRNSRMTQYSLFNWPTLEELQTDSLSEAFTLDTRILSNKNNESKDFACTIKTYANDLLQPLPIHVLYILDTSSTIEAHRFRIFKESIIKSIDYLEPNAKFNIAILKKGKIEMLQENSALPTISSRGFAKRYLRKIAQSQCISFEDLASLIEKEKLLAAEDITHRLCILLSDGKFASNIRIDQEDLKKLTNEKIGNFSLYTASVSDKNNKPMLSLLAKLNHGFSLYTRTHSSFSRKFSLLVKHLQHPLMHDIIISFPDDEDAKVYLEKQTSPILLADKSFTFYGNNETKASRVFIQGKSGDRWINILKELPLNTARKGRYTFQKKLANQKTFLSLYSFLQTKDEKYLTEAKKYLSAYDLPLPIQ